MVEVEADLLQRLDQLPGQPWMDPSPQWSPEPMTSSYLTGFVVVVIVFLQVSFRD